MYPKAAVDVSMLVPSISHAQIPNPVKCKIPSQSPGFSRFQPKNYPLDSTKTPKSLLSRSKFGKRGCVGTFSVSTIHPRKTAHCLHRMDLDCGISSASGNLSNYGGTTNKRARANSLCGFQNRKANFCPSPAQDHTNRHSKNLERCGPSATRFSILLP